jgi:hemerythrin-like metal-binding protein
MSLLKWKNEYSVGVQEIDNQHMKLIELINKLFDAMKQGQANAVIGQILNELSTFASTHFKTEEKYFELFDYMESEKHKEIHQIFVMKITKFKNYFDAGQITLSVSIFNFLKDWLNDHILGEDMKYTECFNKNGLF